MARDDLTPLTRWARPRFPELSTWDAASRRPRSSPDEWCTRSWTTTVLASTRA